MYKTKQAAKRRLMNVKRIWVKENPSTVIEKWGWEEIIDSDEYEHNNLRLIGWVKDEQEMHITQIWEASFMK